MPPRYAAMVWMRSLSYRMPNSFCLKAIPPDRRKLVLTGPVLSLV